LCSFVADTRSARKNADASGKKIPRINRGKLGLIFNKHQGDNWCFALGLVRAIKQNY
jgi:hypothetical protein